MTVPSEINRSGPYNGNGSTTVFGYGFRIVDEDHIKVIRTSAAGVETVLVIDADYIVSDVGQAAGGQIACIVAPAAGQAITILRNVPFTQETDLENQGAYYAETVEDALDLAAMRDQQLSEEVSRAIRIPASSTADVELPAPEPSKFLAWNSDGDAIENIDRGDLVSIVAYGTAIPDIFTGNGSATVFNLSENPAAIGNLDVSIGGVSQLPGIDYFWTDGTALTFNAAPASGVKILARYMRGLPFGYTSAGNVSLLGGASVQDALKYFRSSLYEVRIGYDSISDQPAAVKIGANDANRGRGVLQIGGAGKLDGGNGAYLSNDGHPNWNTIQSTLKFNPTEWNIYGNGTGGIATRSGVNTLTKLEGVDWDTSMIGRVMYFRGVPFTVSSVPSATTITLTSDPAAGTGAWNYIVTSGSGTCSISGVTVKRISGEPFCPATAGVWNGSPVVFKVNGVSYAPTYVDTDTYTLPVAPGDALVASYYYAADINAQIATNRIQKVAGASEENLAIFARPDGYWIVPAAAGSGELYPLWLCSNYERVVELHATGKFVSLGGVAGSEAARFPFIANAVNRIEHCGGVGTGRANMRARSDVNTNVGFNFDTQGTGDFLFTSGSFGRTNFKVYGSNGADFLSIDAVTGAPFIAAEGVSANIDIALTPKGAGLVRFGAFSVNADAPVTGYITIKDSGGTTRKLAVIA